MDRPETTLNLSQALEKHIDPHNDTRIYWAKEVTFDYASGNAIRVDYMRFAPKNNSVSGIEHGDFYCYEIKSSIADFQSKNGHNFIGDYNYYVMPEDVADHVKSNISFYVGILVPDACGGLRVLKTAKRKDRSRPISEMLLMMWRSSRREIIKIRRNEKESRGEA